MAVISMKRGLKVGRRLEAFAAVELVGAFPGSIEQLRQMERATERRMVAVHKIVFPG